MIDVPEFFTARRAKFLSGFGHRVLDALPRYGSYRQIGRADLERVMGRTLTAADWDRATVAINRAGIEQRGAIQ